MKQRVESAKFTHRFGVIAPTRDRAASGQLVTTYNATPVYHHGSIEALNSTEPVYANGVQALATHRVSMRFVGSVTALHRLTWDGRNFEVVGAPLDPDGRKKIMHLLVREVTS